MKIFLFAFGKLKTPGLRDAADYYKKLTHSWAPIEEVEIKPLSVPDKSQSTRLRIQEKESEILLDRLKSEISKRGVFYLLDETGKLKTTLEWSQEVRHLELKGIPSVSFCIGSSLGFSKELRQKAQGCLSLGPQTLPHELARVVLLEQIYRSYSVMRGHPYHNEG